MNSCKPKQTIIFANLRNWDILDMILSIFLKNFRMILPKIRHSVLGSRFAPWKKNKAWHWTPPPPFQYGPFSTGLPFTTTRSGERLCSIWCVPSTVITASQKPTIATYYTNILLLTNITTWKKKVSALLICTITTRNSDNNINPPLPATSTMPTTYFFYPQC